MRVGGRVFCGSITLAKNSDLAFWPQSILPQVLLDYYQGLEVEFLQQGDRRPHVFGVFKWFTAPPHAIMGSSQCRDRVVRWCFARHPNDGRVSPASGRLAEGRYLRSLGNPHLDIPATGLQTFGAGALARVPGRRA
jgi:hypothetical protein